MMSNFLPPAYFYMNGFVIAMGVWSLISYESAEAMFLVRSDSMETITCMFAIVMHTLSDGHM